MRLFLVRHGQTDWNREPARCQGWAEMGLNEVGRGQARDLGRALKGRGVELSSAAICARSRPPSRSTGAGGELLRRRPRLPSACGE
jgi:probable phosphoglycerate mutase